jgi:hypothetical protein
VDDGHHDGNSDFLVSYEAMSLSCQSIWTKLQDLQAQSEYVDEGDTSEALSDNVCIHYIDHCICLSFEINVL